MMLYHGIVCVADKHEGPLQRSDTVTSDIEKGIAWVRKHNSSHWLAAADNISSD